MRFVLLLIVAVVLSFLVYRNFGSVSGTNVNSPSAVQSAVEKTKNFACERNLKMLNDFVKNYMSAHGIDNSSEVSVEQLKDFGLVIPQCPEGGEYFFQDGKFYCTVHSDN